MLVLAIETSCDDTSVSLVDDTGFVKDLGSANQDLLHSPFGGVVPEIASRGHTETLLPLIDQILARSNTTWAQVDGIAVTSEPGLLGSLLVGVVTAKALALAHGKPLIGVNHIEGHLMAPLLVDQNTGAVTKTSPFPYIALAVSGGHT
ncbi:MAG: tRNA (adenosine(37)-N6)-threonylcarbamoyltransferase complex transferase subunit TsaD, partial [Bdellovibrionales bacterium]|nr:tRNA (adenosine(37)-N6)-threonylcarbamoyltransferase complex transferase subunit TsaD [Bdellovibrionales bacterium]